jgi:putative toxin-antitoxin system antitoxin component (TIGR02293 family)
MTLAKPKLNSAPKARERKLKRVKARPLSFQVLRQLSKNTPQALSNIMTGFSPDVLTALASGYAVPQHTIQTILGVTDGTLDRRRKAGTLSDTESDSVLRLVSLFDLAANVLGGDEQAKRWLTNQQHVLGNVTPLELAKTSVGSDYVRSVLNALEYGLPS